ATVGQPLLLALQVGVVQSFIVRGLEPDAVAWLAGAMPEGCAVVATSRRALGWDHEQRIEVPPLGDGPATQVFLDAAPRRFVEVVGDDDAALGRILERLAGLPLALRLAAGRLDMVDLPTLERLLEERYLEVLADPDDPGRHGSIDKVVAWSWDLLAPGRRTALMTCTAFGGPFDLESATAVLDDPLDDLHALVRRHLLEVEGGVYRVPEPVQPFVRGHLAAAEEGGRIWGRVDAWWSARVAEWAHDLAGPAHAATLEAAGRSWRGLTRLVAHGDDAEARRAYAVLAELVDTRGPAAQGVRWATVLLDRATSTEARAEALAWRSRWRRRLGAVAEAEADADAAMALTDRGDPGARARMERAAMRMQRGLVDLATRRSEIEAALDQVESPVLRAELLAYHALALHDTLPAKETGPINARIAEAIAHAEATGCPAVQLQVHAQAGTIHLERSYEPEETQHHLKRALDLAEELGRRRKQGVLLGQLALAVEGSDPRTALARYDDAVRRLREAGDPVHAATWMGMRSRTELLTGSPVRARRDLEASLGWLDRAGDLRIRWFLEVLLIAEAASRGETSRIETFATASPPARDKEELTLEVVRKLAEGLTAAEVDDEETYADCLARVRELAGMTAYHEVYTLAEWAVSRLEEAPGWWRIDVDGHWHQPPGADPCPVKGTANQRLLACLAAMRLDEPGRCATTDTLASAGWPGERTIAKAAGNRVRVALSTLRGTGLAPLIERGDDGWRLAPDHPVRRIGRLDHSGGITT
ncbi:MAG: hypothetical protein AAF211_06185, partial [Myxococcota bacterium]